MFVPTIQKLIENKRCFIERHLPVPGRISVSVGEKVKAFDVVGEAEIKPREGEKALRGAKREFKLTAGADGKIAKIVEGRAVLAEAVASSISALLGYGSDVEGELVIIAESDKEITLESLSADHRGKILVGGSKVSGPVLKKAEALGIKGIVCGGIDYADTVYLTLPTLITEGFGTIPMNRQTFEFFKSVAMRYVILSIDRRAVLIPLLEEEIGETSEHTPPSPFLELKVDHSVQIFCEGYFGHTGKVKKIFSERKRFASGISEEACEVELSSGEEVVVPIRNVGVLV